MSTRVIREPVIINGRVVLGLETYRLVSMARAADDFATIGARYKELTTIPEPRRSGASTNHCAHCPKNGDEVCNLNCHDEGVKAGVAG
jgi:hypothetical protein